MEGESEAERKESEAERKERYEKELTRLRARIEEIKKEEKKKKEEIKEIERNLVTNKKPKVDYPSIYDRWNDGVLDISDDSSSSLNNNNNNRKTVNTSGKSPFQSPSIGYVDPATTNNRVPLYCRRKTSAKKLGTKSINH